MDEIFEHISDNYSKQSRYDIDLFLLENGHRAEDIERGWQKLQLSLLPPTRLVRFFRLVLTSIVRLVQGTVWIIRTILLFWLFHVTYIGFWFILGIVVFSEPWMKIIGFTLFVLLIGPKTCLHFAVSKLRIVRATLLFCISKKRWPSFQGLFRYTSKLTFSKAVFLRTGGVLLIWLIVLLQGSLAKFESRYLGLATPWSVTSRVYYNWEKNLPLSCFPIDNCGDDLRGSCQIEDLSKDTQTGWLISTVGLPYPIFTNNNSKSMSRHFLTVKYNDKCIVDYTNGVWNGG